MLSEVPRKVWVVNAAGHDHSAAEPFGELHAVTEGRAHIFNVQRQTAEMCDILDHFRPDDWLLLSGHVILNCLATAIIMKKHGNVNFLIYDVVRKEYVPRNINEKQVSNMVSIS